MSGLREVKKDRTRTQLLEAALTLFSKQGFEETTISQIADSVLVSPRTLLRYFSTKEDIIVSSVEGGMAVFRDTLMQRSSDEAPFHSLSVAARAMLGSYDARSDFFLVIERAIAASSAVAARKQQLIEELAQEVGNVLVQRTGSKTQERLLIDIQVGAIFAVLRATIRAWVSAKGKQSILDLYDRAISTVVIVDSTGTGTAKRRKA